jgi:hypothetical protein
MLAHSLLVTSEAITDMSKAFADISTDELLFWPALADLDQIYRVEDALG